MINISTLMNEKEFKSEILKELWHVTVPQYI